MIETQALTLNAVKELRNIANSLEALAGIIEGENITPSKESKEKQPTLEEVREAMAEKNREGYRESVKAILVKYGANKLTALDPKHYDEVLKEVGEIK